MVPRADHPEIEAETCHDPLEPIHGDLRAASLGEGKHYPLIVAETEASLPVARKRPR